jgi:hypothetical protein
MTLKAVARTNSIEEKDGMGEVKNRQEDTHEKKGEIEYVFDTEYVKKMLKFHKQVNESENIIGVYISSLKIDKESMIIVQYFMELFKSKKVKSPLTTPIIMMFDPELRNNKLEIKILNLHSTFFIQCPILSEMPYKFNLENIDRTGLDVLFYGQEHFDTMAILDDKREFNAEIIGEMIKNQKVL